MLTVVVVVVVVVGVLPADTLIIKLFRANPYELSGIIAFEDITETHSLSAKSDAFSRMVKARGGLPPENYAHKSLEADTCLAWRNAVALRIERAHFAAGLSPEEKLHALTNSPYEGVPK